MGNARWAAEASEYQRVRDWPPKRSWAQGVLVVCSHRMRLSGPRSLRQMGILLLGPLIIVIFLLSSGRTRQTVLKWSPDEKLAGPEGLRIVVFGSQDTLGSAHDATHSRTTWPEHLCQMLKCSSLVSLVPPIESQPGLISNAAYNASLSAVTKLTQSANITDVPASDQFYIVEQYPVPKTPDLTAQVSKFLSMNVTGEPPRTTLWIFSFGTWDIWNLAALPREMSEPIIDASVDLLFEQIDLLYRKALKPGTIAWSDYWAHVAPEDLEYVTHPPEKRVNFSKVEGFRILIPELLDVSLTPGWQKRLAPSMPYTRSMELRNAASLTTRWNGLVSHRLEDWRRMRNDKPKGIEEEGIAMIDFMPPSIPPEHREQENQNEGKHGLKITYAPYPFRVALHATIVSTIITAMAEQDLQQAGITDGRGRGTLSRKDPMMFTDVRTPCVASEEGANVVTVSRSGTKCKRPDDHLFYDEFTLGQRASKQLAQKAAEYLHSQQVI
ncbi:hypothetical protein ESCO_002127 [Escovopsis weberi]|uniref:Uncharacterized protein n=1 Tax=Escovopsis weberi TaxID=150374 RepID=A0A0M9VWR5_ESCWE|nr:hypothetical protein ESCO_002127 [Escovopsis weberi]